jgi:hypothetical protein
MVRTTSGRAASAAKECTSGSIRGSAGLLCGVGMHTARKAHKGSKGFDRFDKLSRKVAEMPQLLLMFLTCPGMRCMAPKAAHALHVPSHTVSKDSHVSGLAFKVQP